MKYSQIKQLKAFCSDLHSEPNWREVLESELSQGDDFTVDSVRFIREDSILSIMAEEIFSDDYLLGCFNASFIASNSSLNLELIEACQEGDAVEAIGKALNDTLTDTEKEAFCEAYASADGYGHHFNHYDGNEESITINGTEYLVFDNH